MIFDSYCQAFIYEGEAGLCASYPMLRFSLVLNWKIFILENEVPYYLRRVDPVLTLCKVPKYMNKIVGLQVGSQKAVCVVTKLLIWAICNTKTRKTLWYTCMQRSWRRRHTREWAKQVCSPVKCLNKFEQLAHLFICKKVWKEEGYDFNHYLICCWK